MKRQIVSLLLACTVAFSFTGCATEHHSAMYEYKIITGRMGGHSSTLPPIEQQLDQAAADGWQVVSGSSDNGEIVIILKKRK